MTAVQRRVVVDPGVLLAGFISSGGPSQACSTLCSSVEPSRSSRHGWCVSCTPSCSATSSADASPDEVDAFVVRLLARTDLVDDPQQIPPVSRDPDDDYIIALARTEQDVVVVSGDDDLLTLDLPDIDVLTPRVFLDTLADPQ